jgi:hypothetical protein
MHPIYRDDHVPVFVHTVKGRKVESSNGKLIGRYYRRFYSGVDHVNFCLVADLYGQIKYVVEDRRGGADDLIPLEEGDKE